MLNELDKTLDAVDREAIRCLILTGAGEKSFVAGADIGEMSTLTKAEGEAFGKKGNDVFRKLETFPIPVIAAVNGFALGGGCEISMSCDIRICSENAVFGQPEVGLGITPVSAAPSVWPASSAPARPKRRSTAPAILKRKKPIASAW